ncbi:MAG: SRPBCC domain-containing protein [Anaerolineales bacterium]|nr:SRPBCC domain-containing protein [Anaerolineales bacterium]
MTMTVQSEQTVAAPPEQVYFAFTRSILLRQWLCDFASVTPRPAGRMYLWWNGDFYSAGEYLALEENQSIQFKWFARGEPAASVVSVSLAAQDNGTRITLEHAVPDGEGWQERAVGFKAEWDRSLVNLAAVLDTGLDRRLYDRPMLGVLLNDYTAEIAKALGVPVDEGLRLAGTVEGMGAQAAGLQQDDVIISFNGKPVTTDFNSLAAALHGTKGGDQVEVVFYRGPEKKTVTMELGRRPIPVVPATPAGFAAQAREAYDRDLADLARTLDGVSEAEADHKPAPGEWSARQTLAHLIHTERAWLAGIEDEIRGYVRQADDFGPNLEILLDATARAHGSIAAMLVGMQTLSNEVVAFLAALPPELVARKVSYLNLGNAMLSGAPPHLQGHTEQIRNAIADARK